MKLPGGLGDILEQAQKMQGEIARLQKEAEQKTVEASSGGGMVTITMTGGFQIVSVKIDPSVVNQAEIEMLQDLIAAASNEAVRKAKDMMKAEISAITGGLPIPGFG